jgi:hypothetical protein
MSRVRTQSASASTFGGGYAGRSVVCVGMPLAFAMSASAMGYLNRFLKRNLEHRPRLVWQWDGQARKCFDNCYQPMFNVADNGLLIVDQQKNN